MAVRTYREHIPSRGDADVIDITPLAQRTLQQSGMKNGIFNVFVPGATAAVTTIEFESGVVQDLKAAIERLVPKTARYQHDQRWGDGNGHSHVRAALLKPGLAIPFEAGRLLLGTWQQIILLDFDNRPRTRELVLQIVGE